jgi:Arc/MetJ-type ribon-helix-helix transcriptional regulator
MNNGKQVSIRLTPADISKIENCVNKGHAMNVVDFIRMAVREKCNEIGIEIEHEKGKQVVFAGGG